MRQSARAALSSLLLLSTIAPVAIHATATTAPVAAHTLARPPRVPHATSPTPAQRARLLARYGQLPLGFERADGQAGRGAAYVARGAGYGLYVTAKGATLVLAAPHVVSRTLPRPGAARPPLLAGRPHLSHLSQRLATDPLTPTVTIAASPSATGTLALTATATATPTVTGTLGAAPATSPVPLVTPTILAAATDTGTVASTATITPTASGAASVTASATPATVVAHGRLARPTIPAGAGTVTPVPSAPPSIVRHGPGITQTAVLTPTGLAAAMALHLQHHGHAHGTAQRHQPAAPPAVVQLVFAGANPAPQVVGLDALSGTANYLLGTNRHAWTTKLPTYGRVAYRGLYPGIDLAFHGRQGTLEYDWLLAPRAAAGRIRLAVHGAGHLQIDRQGDLLLQTVAGMLRQARPVAYQQVGGQRRPVTARYILRTGHEIGLAVGAYDHTRPLVIDPVLSYSTYLGGSALDQGTGIAVDGSGDVYVTGDTFSSNFPTLTPEQATFAGGTHYGDAFITKLTPDGSSLVYSTYLGGSADEDVWKIVVDSAGEAVIAGYTASTNFPTVNAAQPTYGGGPYDGFVSKLSADGASLVYSTYLGGRGDDEGYGVALDGSGNAYVTGLTSSPNFPTTATAAQGYFGGYYDAFVTELAPSGSLVYSTYLGGSSDDDGYAIAVDGAGNAYVAGATASANFPVSTNAYQPSFVGGCSRSSCTYDAFVAKISAGGTSIAYGTYLGGSGDDMAEGIAVDGNGNAWVTGNTASVNFPTANAPQSTFGGGPYDAFVAELTPDGSGLAYSTYLGGSGDDEAYALALDTSGNVYVAGETASTNFPVVNAAQSTFGGGPYDAFVAELSAAGGGTVYATYLGGSGDDAAFGLAVAPDGSVAVTGLTSSTDFPTTNAVQSTYNSGSYDAFVAGLAAAPAGATCPDYWSCDDIGSPPLAGDQTLSNGTWTVRGSGSDIWNSSDQFHYVSQQVSGDSSIVARLTSQQNTSICTKAGIMYRASTDAGDVNYSVVMLPDCAYSTSSVQVNSRSAMSATATTANDVPTNLPVYLKATRTGATFTAYTSSDGATWTPIPNSAVSLPNMPINAMVGLVVCSQNSATTSQATFDNVSVSGYADTTALDTDTGVYTQTVGGGGAPSQLRLHVGPAGMAGDVGWNPLDLTLGLSATTGLYSPARVPFGLGIAPTSGAPTLATLTAVDGITLGLGLAANTPATAGHVNGSAVTYPGVVPSGSDLSLRATSTGLDARVVLHSANEGGPFVFALAPDPRTQLAQDPSSGTITVTQVVTSYGDDGVTPYIVTQTEYMIQPAVATATSSDPASPADVGAVTMSLGTGASGAPTLALNVDPAWLSRHATAYPVMIDLPIMTEDGYGQTGVFGTVNSCAPATPAPLTEMVVGVENGCTYNGQAYFDLSALPNQESVLTATLRLYTPGQTSATGVQVFPNAAPADLDAAGQTPSWTTAPVIMTGSVGLAQSASAGGWQSWDVTSIMHGWINDQTTNGGFTLTGNGAPVRFASPLGAGSDAPALTPYLDITYQAPSAPSGSFQAMATTAAAPSGGPYRDNASFIYGVNGNQDVCQPSLNPLCPSLAANMDATGSNEPVGPGARFVRINTVDMPCGSASPSSTYFNPTYRLMAEAYKRKLTPVVVLGRGANCGASSPTAKDGTPLSTTQWNADGKYFVQHMTDSGSELQNAYDPLPPTYFEIGNEPNPGLEDYKFGGFQNYPARFYAAATGLYQGLTTADSSGRTRAPSYYRILTGGVFRPDGEKGCNTNSLLPVIADAINRAKAVTGLKDHLGVAVHPYGFTTSRFLNYFKATGGSQGYRNLCRNLGAMNSKWLMSFPGMPLVYTEINYGSSASDALREGSYLTDLFTYLYDTRSQQSANPSTPYIAPSYDRLRVLWQSIIDFPANGGTIRNGLYTSPQGGHKPFTVAYCPNPKSKNVHTGSNRYEDQVYYYLRNQSCY